MYSVACGRVATQPLLLMSANIEQTTTLLCTTVYHSALHRTTNHHQTHNPALSAPLSDTPYFTRHPASTSNTQATMHHMVSSGTNQHYCSPHCTTWHHLTPTSTTAHHSAPHDTNQHYRSPLCTTWHHLAPTCTTAHHSAPHGTI